MGLRQVDEDVWCASGKYCCNSSLHAVFAQEKKKKRVIFNVQNSRNVNEIKYKM